jgi:hypothetical protein
MVFLDQFPKLGFQTRKSFSGVWASRLAGPANAERLAHPPVRPGGLTPRPLH